MSHTEIRTPIEWITMCTIAFFSMIGNILILQKEHKKRKSSDILFNSIILKISSMSCIISGVLIGFMSFVRYFNGFCYFSEQIILPLMSLQSIFMGIYQLSRLYYCFSQNKVYSNKGYPNWLFIIMYIIGISSFIISSIGIWFFIEIPMFCGINKQYLYIGEYRHYRYHSSFELFTGICLLVYSLWDLTTLCLYVIKIISFNRYKSQQIDVYQRILLITNRILILTILYEIMVLMVIISTVFMKKYGRGSLLILIFYVSSGQLLTNIMNYSMFLMQQHNTYQYQQFLKLLYYFKLYHVCCCCFKTIIENEIDLEKHIDDNKNEKNDNGVNGTEQDTTTYETNGIGPNHAKIDAKPYELSIETIYMQSNN